VDEDGYEYWDPAPDWKPGDVLSYDRGASHPLRRRQESTDANRLSPEGSVLSSEMRRTEAPDSITYPLTPPYCSE